MNKLLLISFAVLSALILIVFLVVIFLSGYFEPDSDAAIEPTAEVFLPVQTTSTREEVIGSLTEFINSSMNSDGNFVSRYRCEFRNCLPQVELEKYVSYPILALLSAEVSGNEGVNFKDRADLAMGSVLASCEKNTQVCSDNLAILYKYYQDTEDVLYKNLILSVATENYVEDRIATQSSTQLIDDNFFKKLEIFYNVTGDNKYKQIIVDAADETLENWPYGLNGASMYVAEIYPVTFDMPLAINGLLLPACRITGDRDYCSRAEEFYLNVSLADNMNAFASQGEVGTIALLNAVEGLTVLNSMNETNLDLKPIFASEATLLMNRLIGWYYDSPSRVVFNGDGGILTGFVRDVPDPNGVNYKRVSIDGWIAVLLQDPVFEGLDLQLYTRVAN